MHLQEEQGGMRSIAPDPAPPQGGGPGAGGDAEAAIRDALVCHAALFRRYARQFILRAHLAHGDAARDLAQDILQDLSVEALQSAHRLDLQRSARSWLMGVLLNVLRQHRDEIFRQRRRTYQRAGSAEEDAAFFDWVAARAGHLAQGREAALGDAQEMAGLLSRLEPKDREVLELGVVLELDGQELAERLGIAPGTARQRLHRAKARLHALWLERKGGAR
jgi:RNA polymerase sigma-70 factor (ECF subfamily)